jgi:Flp pilus assembly protein TadD
LAIIIALGILTSLQIGVWHDTFTLWNTAIARRPATSLAYMNRGVAWARINEWPRAQIDLERAVELWPTDPNSLQNLANVLASRGDFVNSEHYARRAVQSDPNMAKARMDLGFALLQLDRVEEACEQYRAAFNLDPSTWPVLNGLIEGLVAQGQRDLARQLATAAVSDQPQVHEARAALERLNGR